MFLSFYVESVLWGVFDFYLSLKEGDPSNFIKNCAREGKRFKVFDKNDAIIVKGDDFIWNYGDDSESGSGEGNGAPWSILRFRLSDWIKFLRREIMNNAFNWINSRDD